MHLVDALDRLTLSPLNAGHYSGRTKLCIYGAGLGKHEAPLDNPDWDVWAINVVPPLDSQTRLRCDLWFDLHQRKAQSPKDLQWIARCPVPIYLPPDLADASENYVQFPLDEIEEYFKCRYWSCTFAYQIALALYQGHYTDIGLYGMELAWGGPRERTVEWACVAYWLGRAQERGVKVHVPKRSLLGQHFARYGFEYDREKKAVEDYLEQTGEGADVGGA